jgi:DNA-binding NtrC family response regulator
MSKLLVVDEDVNTLELLARSFRLAGHEVVICERAVDAITELRSQRFDIIVSEVMMPGKDGLTFLAELKALGILSPVLMISDKATLEMAVKATRLGAADFVEKPVSFQKLLISVENVLRMSRLEEENRRLRQRVGKQELVWQSSAMEKVIARLNRVADSETRVCIYGETGTERELLARTIHDRSPRWGKPFLSLNCGSVPAEVVDSELFGHEIGVFPGASSQHAGKFEQASGGTLFLDEIAGLPSHTQARLLRVLEERNSVDVRVVFGTHSNLEELVRRRIFREDLYHHVFAFPLIVPPLRERSEDIPLLTDYFASMITRQNDWRPRVISAAAYAELQRYHWPGNIRELRNIVERLLLLANAEIDAGSVCRVLGSDASGVAPPAATSGGLFERVETFEREVIVAELKRNDFRMTDTARALGLERSHLYKKCRHLSIDHKSKNRTKSFPLQKGTDPE